MSLFGPYREIGAQFRTNYAFRSILNFIAPPFHHLLVKFGWPSEFFYPRKGSPNSVFERFFVF